MIVIIIGREQDCNVILSDVKVSRHHAQLVNDNGIITICDLNSKNGTFVNGVRIYTPKTLHYGDQVALGGVAIPWEQYLSNPQPSRQMPMNQIPVNQPPVNQFPIQESFVETNSVKQQKEHKLLPLWISLAVILLVASVFWGIRMNRSNRIDNKVTDSIREKQTEIVWLEQIEEDIKEKQEILNNIKEDANKALLEAENAKKEAETYRKQAEDAKKDVELEKTRAEQAKMDADKAKKEAELEKKKAEKAKKDFDNVKINQDDVESISALYFAIDQMSSEQFKNACDELGCSNKEGLVNKFKISSEEGRKRIFSVLQKWTE